MIMICGDDTDRVERLWIQGIEYTGLCPGSVSGRLWGDPVFDSLLTRVRPNMSCSLNSLKGGYIGKYIVGDYYRGVIKRDTRSLDYGSFRPLRVCGLGFRVGRVSCFDKRLRSLPPNIQPPHSRISSHLNTL